MFGLPWKRSLALGVVGVGLTLVARGDDAPDLVDKLWAYQPLTAPVAPPVTQEAWVRTSVDRFILARLEAANLSPGPDADRSTLVRRVYYDLIGLPPSPDEIDAFLADTSEQALVKLIDSLMTRPQFGEKWGRHWLDVARFAESVTLRGLIFKEAWRYRDYVIDAFNRDLPYDQFVREQVAGDLMEGGSVEERQRRLIGTTFLMIGNWNLEDQDKKQQRMDVVDEQLDTIGKAFLGQTLGCARCHDHKFDPIPTRDYYALAGILRSCRTLVDANVSSWVEVPLPLEADEEQQIRDHEGRVSVLSAQLKQAKAALSKRSGTALDAAAGPVAAESLSGVVIDDVHARRVGAWQHSQHVKTYVGEGYLEDRNEGKGSKTVTFQPDTLATGRYDVRLAYTPGSNRAQAVPVTVFSADGEVIVMVDQRQTPPIDGHFISLGLYRFEDNGQGFVLVATDGTSGHVIADAVQFLRIDQVEARETIESADAANSSAPDTVKELEAQLKQLQASGPKRPMAMSVREEDIGDTYVHRRGSVHTLGEEVPRGFLEVIPGGASIAADESGRLQLGDWLTNPDNPLTARVMVNRLWHWLFGAGLVRSADNFGTTGQPPSHPELLDHLAAQFMEEGWSVKRCVRELMLSHVYQLSVEPTPAALRADPENRLWARMNRRRLDAEALRDTMLAVSGELRLDQGGGTVRAGASADYGHRFDEPRRSVYVPVLRNALPELFLLFDFADPSMVTGVRSTSTVAPQALYLMNHPFVMDRARRAAELALSWPESDTDQRLGRAYRQTLGRAPTLGEREVARAQLEGAERDVERWAELYQALFASLDFRCLN